MFAGAGCSGDSQVCLRQNILGVRPTPPRATGLRTKRKDKPFVWRKQAKNSLVGIAYVFANISM